MNDDKMYDDMYVNDYRKHDFYTFKNMTIIMINDKNILCYLTS